MEYFFCWMHTVPCISGVDWNNGVAVFLHVLGCKIAGTMPLSGQANHGNGFCRFKYLPQLLNIVMHKESWNSSDS